MGDFDFDYWKDLAETDPAGFFQARHVALRAFICRDPRHEAALSDFQNHLDATRLLAGSPQQASRALFGLMEDQLRLLGARLADLQRETETLRDTLGAAQPA